MNYGHSVDTVEVGAVAAGHAGLNYEKVLYAEYQALFCSNSQARATVHSSEQY